MGARPGSTPRPAEQARSLLHDDSLSRGAPRQPLASSTPADDHDQPPDPQPVQASGGRSSSGSAASPSFSPSPSAPSPASSSNRRVTPPSATTAPPQADQQHRPADQRPARRATPRHRHPLRPGSFRALFQLATDLPAAVLASMLGIHISVAVQWQRLSATTRWPTPDVERTSSNIHKTPANHLLLEYAQVSAKIDALYGQPPQLPADYESAGMARLRREAHARRDAHLPRRLAIRQPGTGPRRQPDRLRRPPRLHHRHPLRRPAPVRLPPRSQRRRRPVRRADTMINKTRLMHHVLDKITHITPNICISPRVAVVALSSTDQPVRGGLSAIRYRRSRAAPPRFLPWRSWDATVPLRDPGAGRVVCHGRAGRMSPGLVMAGTGGNPGSPRCLTYEPGFIPGRD